MLPMAIRYLSPLTALQYVIYSGFVDDIIFSHNGPMAPRVFQYFSQILLSDKDWKYAL